LDYWISYTVCGSWDWYRHSGKVKEKATRRKKAVDDYQCPVENLADRFSKACPKAFPKVDLLIRKASPSYHHELLYLRMSKRSQLGIEGGGVARSIKLDEVPRKKVWKARWYFGVFYATCVGVYCDTWKKELLSPSLT